MNAQTSSQTSKTRAARTKAPATKPAATKSNAPRVAAFFDLDGTLIPGSANIPFAKAAFKEGFVSKRELLIDFRNGISFILKGATDERSAQVRDRILGAVAGHPAKDVEAIGEMFMDDLIAKLQPAMRKVLDEYGAKGVDRIVLSASPTEIVSRFAEGVGMEYGVGTTSERDENGVYTGRLSGPFCYREGKAAVMEQLAEENGYDLADCYAYSDSVSDMPMLEAVGHPVAVNPEPELRRIAQERGWPIVETASVPRVPLKSVKGITRLTGSLATTAANSLRTKLTRAIA